jgi:hypothetical protein
MNLMIVKFDVRLKNSSGLLQIVGINHNVVNM